MKCNCNSGSFKIKKNVRENCSDCVNFVRERMTTLRLSQESRQWSYEFHGTQRTTRRRIEFTITRRIIRKLCPSCLILAVFGGLVKIGGGLSFGKFSSDFIRLDFIVHSDAVNETLVLRTLELN